MSRAHLSRTVQSIAGALVSGATVTVCQPGTTNPISGVLYVDSTSGALLPNPFQPENGQINFYLDAPQDVDLLVTYGSSSVTAERQPVMGPAEQLFSSTTPVAITNPASANFLLVGVDSSHAVWADPATVETGQIDVAMPIPSTPLVLNVGGLSFVIWDGLDEDGDAMPVGFAQILVQTMIDTVATTVGSLAVAGGILVALDDTVSLQFVAVNRLGTASDPSALVTYARSTALYPTAGLQTTVGTGGAASNLPTKPAQYLPVEVAGTSYVIPLYPVS